jgi:hypothetical protein
MNQAQNSSPIAKAMPIIIIVLGLVALYYLYQYLYGAKSANSMVLLQPLTPANVDPTSPIVVATKDLPPIYEGGEFTVSAWIYIQNWNYRTGLNKHILSIGGQNFDTIRMYLGGQKPKLSIRLQTKTSGGIQTAPNTGSTQVPVESLDRMTENSVFNVLQTDSGLLDSSPLCDLPEIDLQKWVNIAVAVNGKTVDVYMDGKLSRSCVLPDYYKVDAGGYVATLLKYGGFGGQIANVAIYDSALNPDMVYKNYMAGPEPITSAYDWFKSFFTPEQTL